MHPSERCPSKGPSQNLGWAVAFESDQSRADGSDGRREQRGSQGAPTGNTLGPKPPLRGYQIGRRGPAVAQRPDGCRRKSFWQYPLRRVVTRPSRGQSRFPNIGWPRCPVHRTVHRQRVEGDLAGRRKTKATEETTAARRTHDADCLPGRIQQPRQRTPAWPGTNLGWHPPNGRLRDRLGSIRP